MPRWRLANLTHGPSPLTMCATGTWGANVTDVVEDRCGTTIHTYSPSANWRSAARRVDFATTLGANATRFVTRRRGNRPVVDTRQNQTQRIGCPCVNQISDNHAIHTEHGVRRLEVVNQPAVPGDRHRSKDLVPRGTELVFLGVVVSWCLIRLAAFIASVADRVRSIGVCLIKRCHPCPSTTRAQHSHLLRRLPEAVAGNTTRPVDHDFNW